LIGHGLFSPESRRLNGALREFLEAADCEVSIVKVEIEGSRGDTTFTSGTKRYNGQRQSRSLQPIKWFNAIKDAIAKESFQ
jgi:hypothetical protein